MQNGGGGESYKDSASGNHSAGLANFLKKHRLTPSGIPCFGATADHKSCSTPKFAKNYESNTAIPRILEEDKQAGRENPYREQLELESTFTQSPNFSSTILESKSIDKNQAQALESTFSKVDSGVDCHAANAARNDKKSAISEKINSRQMQSMRAYACGLKIACCDCALRFLRFAGVNAIYFYIAQGISSSLLFPILRHFPEMLQIHWSVKLACAFGVNLALCVVFVWVLMAVFAGIGIVGRNMKQVL